jgi:alpha-D-xyloside xylohydrolase
LQHTNISTKVWVANRAFLYTELYNDSIANNWLFPGISPIQFEGPALNLFIPAAYSYFKEHLKVFTDLGVKGFKIDRGEEGEMPVYEQNIQSTLFQILCWELMNEAWGEGNYYTFSRSAVDVARSKTAVWNGDSHSNFTGLEYTVKSGIRAGLIGFSTWASDTGGYVRGVGDPTEELWERWIWFSAFSPVFEIMVGTGHTPWYGNYTEHLVTVLKEATDVHTQLVPYKRSYTYQATIDGVPLIRALWLEFPDDSGSWETEDQYMFGGELLVAPVVQEGGVRDVYFPGDVKWINYLTRGRNNSTVYTGGTTAKGVVSTVDEIPVYIREGAVIVTGDIYKGNNFWDTNWKPYLTVECFPSCNVEKIYFEYFSREGNKTVGVTMTVCDGNVEVVVDNFGDAKGFWEGGVVGEVLVYVEGGIVNNQLHDYGGKFEVKMEKSNWG